MCLRGSSYMTLGTGHPQGGNALGPDPETGVVSPEDFRVHGYANLYVCDASVFPTSTTVNPQVTVMGLAHLAASKVRL
jgi:choline dehydrogenase-like flavoprotein